MKLKSCLLLGRKIMTNLDSILKSRHYFADKGPDIQRYGFSSRRVWMWELDHKEGWARKTDAFELWCWRRFLRLLWRARRSNQSILKEINPKYSLEGLMLKLQYFGHLMQRADSFEKTLTLGNTEGRGEGDDRGWDGWMASPTQWMGVCAWSGKWWRTWKPGVLQSMWSQSTEYATEEQQYNYYDNFYHKAFQQFHY